MFTSGVIFILLLRSCRHEFTNGIHQNLIISKFSLGLYC